MDLGAWGHYVPVAMELLLILSAMLSAVTGAFSATRGPEERIHEAEAAVGARLLVAVAEEQAAPAGTHIPEDAAPGAEVAALSEFALADSIPIYADRLLE
jgi:hypothetical protein